MKNSLIIFCLYAVSILGYLGFSLGCSTKTTYNHLGKAGENLAPVLHYTGTVNVPKPPKVKIARMVSDSEVELFIEQEFSNNIIVGSLDDYDYAILDRESVLKMVGYIPLFRNSIDIPYVSELWDCEQYARLWSIGVQLALLWSYGEIENGQALVAVISVEQKVEWGGVPPGGYHALNGIPAWGPDGLEIIVVEPQSGAWTTHNNYPNKPFEIELE